MGIIAKIYKRKMRLQRRERQLALDTARGLARILGEKFGARKVILYGSLAGEKYFDSASDIDIAVKDIGDKFFRAYSYCRELTQFEVDIRDYDEMTPEIKRRIDKEGRVLYERGREV